MLYHDGRKDCVWVEENMSTLQVLMLVDEVVGGALKGRVMWNSVKYERRELI